jgi:bifunctional DNase/RNase
VNLPRLEQRMEIRCELVRIMITETGDHQVIVLKESHGERAFPIVIGFFEAAAIDRRIKGHVLPRPMTHDLLGSVIEAMGGRLTKIVVTDLKEHTFFANLVIRRNGEDVLVDARPSDAIALAVAGNTPIFVEEHVLNEVAGPGNPGFGFNV